MKKNVRYEVVIGDLHGCHTSEHYDDHLEAFNRFKAWAKAGHKVHLVTWTINFETLEMIGRVLHHT